MIQQMLIIAVAMVLQSTYAVCPTTSRVTNALQSAPALPQTPPARVYFTTTSITDPIGSLEYTIVFGGCSMLKEQGTNATSSHLRALSLNDLWAYEFKSRVWFELSVQEGQPIPSPRFGHGAAAFDDGQRMIIFGGNVLPRGTPGSCDDLQHTSAETWVFSPATPISSRNWTKVIKDHHPSGRAGHAMVSMGALAYLFGGASSTGQFRLFDDLWAFETSTFTWRQIESTGPPPARFGMSMVTLVQANSLQAVLFGGTNGTRCFNDLWKLSAKGEWSQQTVKGNSPTPRAFHAASATSDMNMLIHAGKEGEDPTDEAWEYDFATQAWEKLKPWSFIDEVNSELTFHARDIWGHQMTSYPASSCTVNTYLVFGGLHSTMSPNVTLPVGEVQEYVLASDTTGASKSLVWRPSPKFTGPFDRSGHRVVTTSRINSNSIHTISGCRCLETWYLAGHTYHGCTNPQLKYSSNWCLVESCSTARFSQDGYHWDYCGTSRLIMFGGHFNRAIESTYVQDSRGVVWEYDAVSTTWGQDPYKNSGQIPEQRFDHTMSLRARGTTSSIIVYGGSTFINNTAARLTLDDVWEYIPSTPGLAGSWGNFPVISVPADAVLHRTGHSAEVYNDMLWVFGGETAGPCQGSCPELRLVGGPQFLVFSLSQRTWSRVNRTSLPQPRPRAYHTSALLYSNISSTEPLLVIFGGLASDSLLNDCWAWSFTKSSWRSLTASDASRPKPRFKHSGTTLGRKYLIFGGQQTLWSAEECDSRPEPCNLNDLWEMDIETDSWTQLNTSQKTCNNGVLSDCVDPNIAVRSHAMESMFDQIFVLGGYTGFFGSAYSFAQYSSTAFAFLYHTTPACNAGSSSPEYSTISCDLCPEGEFADSSGTCVCLACKGHSFTDHKGATSQQQCDVCEPNYCHYGECIMGQFGEPLCQCQFGFISLDNCHIPYLIIGPALFVLISLIVIWGVRKRTRFLRKKEFRKMQLAESRREVAELARAWVIKPEDLELQDRLDLFSTGTQGEVYRARWGSMNVAVKKLKASSFQFDSENFTREFDQEVRFIRAIRHPNIVMFFGCGTDITGIPFLVVELMSRGSLQQVLADDTVSLTLDMKTRFALDAAKGMRFLHSCEPPRIHRDLKTANLLVSDQWVVKVSDFGTSRLLEWDNHIVDAPPKRKKWSLFKRDRSRQGEYQRVLDESSLIQHEEGERLLSEGDGDADTSLSIPHPVGCLTQYVGTPLYQAPEVASGGIYGPACDVYSFGVVLWEIITRKIPFEDIASHPWKIREAVQNGDRPVIPTTVPSSLGSLIQNCWSLKINDRPEFQTIVLQLERILESSTVG